MIDDEPKVRLIFFTIAFFVFWQHIQKKKRAAKNVPPFMLGLGEADHTRRENI